MDLRVNEKNAIKIATGICQAKKGKTVITYKGWEAFDGNEEKIVAGVGQGNRRKKCNYKDWETFMIVKKTIQTIFVNFITMDIA